MDDESRQIIANLSSALGQLMMSLTGKRNLSPATKVAKQNASTVIADTTIALKRDNARREKLRQITTPRTPLDLQPCKDS